MKRCIFNRTSEVRIVHSCKHFLCVGPFFYLLNKQTKNNNNNNKEQLELCFKESFVSTKALHNSCVCALLCLTLCDPTDCSPPGFSIHGIFLARILEWVAISSCRGSSWPRDWTHIELTSALASRFFTTESSGNPSSKTLLTLIIGVPDMFVLLLLVSLNWLKFLAIYSAPTW